MTCPECGSEQVGFRVPADLREYLPEETEVAALCTRCLTLEPADEDTASEATESPDFDSISDAFPDGETGVAMALAVGLLDSLALYRTELEALLERVTRDGTDPLLLLDRLATEDDLDPQFDLDRRRTQAEQLLYA
jgi:hypothetical protein